MRELIFVAAFFAAGASAQTTGEAAGKCEALMAASPAMAHPEMQEAVKSSDATFVSIFAKLDELAEGGDANAQYTMALMNQTDTCVNRDLKLALEYHTRAAEAGLAESQRMLAENYLLGPRTPEATRLNVARDPVRAYKFYRLLGDYLAMARLQQELTLVQRAQAEAMAATARERRRN